MRAYVFILSQPLGQTVPHNNVRQSRPFPNSLIVHRLLSRMGRLPNP